MLYCCLDQSLCEYGTSFLVHYFQKVPSSSLHFLVKRASARKNRENGILQSLKCCVYPCDGSFLEGCVWSVLRAPLQKTLNEFEQQHCWGWHELGRPWLHLRFLHVPSKLYAARLVWRPLGRRPWLQYFYAYTNTYHFVCLGGVTKSTFQHSFEFFDSN